MRYFFDIHLDGKCHRDDHGEEFQSAEEARRYVLDCGRTCLIKGLPHERTTMAQCTIEITDRAGLSDFIPMADVLTAHRGRATKGKKSQRDSIYPRSFVWSAQRVGPGLVASCCVALACGVMAYVLMSPSHRALDKLHPSLQGTEAADSGPTDAESKQAVVTMREETRAPVMPVVVNPGAGESQRKETAPAVTRSRASGAQHVRRGEVDAPDGMPSPRHQPPAYRSYMDLRRNFTLNR